MRIHGLTLGSVVLLLAAAFVGCSRDGPARLPALEADDGRTTVFGFSAGAYMAGQFHLAYSSDVVGAALVGGGPWGCAESTIEGLDLQASPGLLNVPRAINGCMKARLLAWGVPDVHRLATRASQLAEAGVIDPVSETAGDRIYIFAGQRDTIVVSEMSKIATEFYRALGVPQSDIKVVAAIPAGHAIVTDDKGSPCSANEAPYIVDCDYHQAADSMAFLRGRSPALPAAPSGRIVTFDQGEFATDSADAGLAQTGAAYVPTECQAKPGCPIHVIFHGCEQNQAAVGDVVIRDSGFLRVADAHGLILLFPQVAKSAVNPRGCWDWWGYTGPDFLARDAPQLAAVRRMLARLAEPRTGAR